MIKKTKKHRIIFVKYKIKFIFSYLFVGYHNRAGQKKMSSEFFGFIIAISGILIIMDFINQKFNYSTKYTLIKGLCTDFGKPTKLNIHSKTSFPQFIKKMVSTVINDSIVVNEEK